MLAADKKQFMAMLTETLASYGKPLPEGAVLAAWWRDLELFSLQVVALAFASYRSESGEFAPVPASIAKRCKTMDGRPTADEAWAIALTSRDEADTVVWSIETAEAFAICTSVLRMGDEVGARMAFKDAYNRLVGEARLAGKPASWNVSLGWDMQRRDAALHRAQAAGLLPAPDMQAMLPNHSGPRPEEKGVPEGLAKLKAELAKLQNGPDKALERREAMLSAVRMANEQRKRDIAVQVAAYQGKQLFI